MKKFSNIIEFYDERRSSCPIPRPMPSFTLDVKFTMKTSTPKTTPKNTNKTTTKNDKRRRNARRSFLRLLR